MITKSVQLSGENMALYKRKDSNIWQTPIGNITPYYFFRERFTIVFLLEYFFF
jgi:hypothetical protein